MIFFHDIDICLQGSQPPRHNIPGLGLRPRYHTHTWTQTQGPLNLSFMGLSLVLEMIPRPDTHTRYIVSRRPRSLQAHVDMIGLSLGCNVWKRLTLE